MAETYREIERRLLLQRIECFKRSIEINAPAAVVALSLPGIIGAAASVYGKPIFERLGTTVVAAERLRLGFCPYCAGDPNRISEKKTPRGESWEMCDACLASVQQSERENPPTGAEIHDLLLLLEPRDHRTPAQIEAWPADDRIAVEQWAITEHLRAADNPIKRLPRPAVMDLDVVSPCGADCAEATDA